VAWIESHQELRDHPKTIRLTGRLGVHRMQAIGHLHALWWWCLAYADDGDLSEFDNLEVATGAGWDGDADEFVESLTAAGWLTDDRQVHDWYDYAGKLVERRRKDRERKADSRGEPADVQRKSAGSRKDGVRTQPNPTVPNQTQPSSLPQLPEERWARRWCEVAGLQPTRSVLRFLIPKVRDFIQVAGEPDDDLLARAHERGIVHPGGWGFVTSEKREPIPDWAKELSL